MARRRHRHLSVAETERVRHAAKAFTFEGGFAGARRLGAGHINATYCVEQETGGRIRRYTLQRINTAVFHDPAALAKNAARITQHLAAKLGVPGAGSRRVLTLVPARDGSPLACDADGGVWRAYAFIERAHTVDRLDTAVQAYEVGAAFGRYLRHLSDLPAPPLTITIPAFHDTPARVAALEKAAAQDAEGRLASARAAVDFALEHAGLAGRFDPGALPQRTVHNDTKINNVLLDDRTGEALCVVDLDTTMPGLSVHDFGDLVRSGANAAAEDEPDPARVEIDLPVYEALTRGYLFEAAPVLTAAELDQFPVAGAVLAYELGVRFLTDFLEGDRYFGAQRPEQNLDRCRTQFRLVEAFLGAEEQMHCLVDDLTLFHSRVNT